MRNLLNFFIEIGKLKRMPRRGWVINQIKNPESIAEHIFRTVLMSWILGEKKEGLNVEKLLKMALIHDLCEIYAGDTTPYDSVLPRSKKKLKELMKTWPRFPNYQKKEQAFKKYKKETEALEKLILRLPTDLKKEIKNLWLDYEKGLTSEGRFFHQTDRMENFLQAYEYWRKYKNPPLGPWWLWAREFFDDSLLIEFMKVLEKKFHQQKIPKKLKPFLVLLNFFNGVGKLKKKERRGWVIHQIKNPETTAEHIFHLVVVVWVLGRNKKINLERAIKMALVHDLCEVYAPDLIPIDALLFKNKKKPTLKKILKSKPKIGYPTIEQREKLAKLKQVLEKKALEKLLVKLPAKFKKEIRDLFKEYNKGFASVARFVKQAEYLINFLQAMEYWKRYKQIPYRLWVRWAKESIDDPILLQFVDEIERKFH